MGSLFAGRCSSCSTVAHPSDPVPSIFKIAHIEQRGKFVIATLNYPNCTTFNGFKILVWENATVHEINALKLIDPHFLDDSKIVARFVPTIYGLQYAKDFVDSQLNK